MTMSTRAYGTLAILAVLTLFSSSVSEAAEQQCGVLANNCVCSRTLEAAGWVAEPAAGFPGAYYEANQDPSDAKLCGFVVNGRKQIYATGAAPQTTTGLSGRTALLNTATVGVLNVEPSEAMKSGLTGRVGMRYYFKLGPGYQTQNEAACSNDKYIQLGDYIDASLGGFKSSAGGPSYGPINPVPNQIIGKWMKIELYLDTYANPTTFTSYLTNLTDGWVSSMTFPARLANDPAHGREWLVGFTQAIHHYRHGVCNGTATLMYRDHRALADACWSAHSPGNGDRRQRDCRPVAAGSGRNYTEVAFAAAPVW